MIGEEQYCAADAAAMRLENAEDLVPLEETDAVQESLYSQYMGVAEYADGSRAFVTFLSETDEPAKGVDGGDPTYAERAIAAERFFNNIGLGDMVPDHYYHDVPAEQYIAVDEVDGDELGEEYKQAAWGASAADNEITAVDEVGTMHVRRASPDYIDAVDADDYLDFAAATLLSGNSDMKCENVMIDERGDLYGIDLDHAGGDFTAHYETAEPWFESHYERGLRYLVANGRLLNMDIDRKGILSHTQAMAKDLEPEAAVEDIENSALTDHPAFQYRDNIRQNIEAFSAGKVPEEWNPQLH